MRLSRPAQAPWCPWAALCAETFCGLQKGMHIVWHQSHECCPVHHKQIKQVRALVSAAPEEPGVMPAPGCSRLASVGRCSVYVCSCISRFRIVHACARHREMYTWCCVYHCSSFVGCRPLHPKQRNNVYRIVCLGAHNLVFAVFQFHKETIWLARCAPLLPCHTAPVNQKPLQAVALVWASSVFETLHV